MGIVANPTSNSIYQQVGYRRVGDAVELSFETPAPSLVAALHEYDGTPTSAFDGWVRTQCGPWHTSNEHPQCRCSDTAGQCWPERVTQGMWATQSRHVVREGSRVKRRSRAESDQRGRLPTVRAPYVDPDSNAVSSAGRGPFSLRS